MDFVEKARNKNYLKKIVKENGSLTMNKLNQVKIGIINYGMGNIGSVQNALTSLNSESGIINSPEDFKKFNAFIMPGVGAFPAAMKNLKKLNLIEELENMFSITKYLFWDMSRPSTTCRKILRG